MAPEREKIRPFLLRRLRVNPVGWATLGVLDEGAEAEARKSLAAAPAGVVLLGEGWSLSIPELTTAIEKVRAAAGAEARIAVVVGKPSKDGGLQAPGDEDFRQWEAAVDDLRDPMVEVVRYEEIEA
jgi:hypothetical protein